MSGLLVVDGVVLGSVATQKAIAGAMHDKEVVKRWDWHECRGVPPEDRGSADDMLSNLRRVISKYGYVILAGFCDLAEVQALYEDCKFGWTSLRDAETVYTRNRYTIELPEATPLK